ncbi:MAG: hypothetical protein NUV64_02145 [Parcubacteria group bacterium]|nr:hypothetical protein [Parcubacteria group bacterium]MCR4342814.1 hypothetical protein [Patescibacteria group bacterium]
MNEETEKIITTEGINQIPSPDNQQEKNTETNSLKKPILRTMKSDMQEYINRQKMSIIDIAGKQAQKQGLKISKSYTNWPNKLITIAVIMLVIISAGVFSYTVIQKKNSQGKKEASKQNLPTPLILPNEQKIITLLKNKQEENKNIINNLILTDTKLGSLTDFIFIDESNLILTSEQFLKSIGINTPLGFSSFLSDKFMFGVYSIEKNEPFIIFKARSYENIFALMLKWEKTMKNDLSSLLPYTGDSSSIDQIFQDRIIKNHDTRIIYSQNGQIDILYSFLDKETIIITSSVETFEEILGRLSSPKL